MEKLMLCDRKHAAEQKGTKGDLTVILGITTLDTPRSYKYADPTVLILSYHRNHAG